MYCTSLSSDGYENYCYPIVGYDRPARSSASSKFTTTFSTFNSFQKTCANWKRIGVVSHHWASAVEKLPICILNTTGCRLDHFVYPFLQAVRQWNVFGRRNSLYGEPADLETIWTSVSKMIRKWMPTSKWSIQNHHVVENMTETRYFIVKLEAGYAPRVFVRKYMVISEQIKTWKVLTPRK